MSTTVTYKGNTITTVNNQTKTLNTAGKYLEADVVLTDSSTGSSVLPTTVILPEQTVTVSGENTLLSGKTEQIAIDNVYLVTVNGERKIVTAQDIYGGASVIFIYYIRFEAYSDNLYLSVYDSSLYGTYTVKIEKVLSLDYATFATKTITTNGTYSASNDSVDGYSSVTVNVSSGSSTPNLQTKTATPTTSSQTITPDSGYDGLSSVTVGAIPSQYIVPTGNKAITENGNNIDVTEYATVSVSVASGSGSTMNVQTEQSTDRRNNTALGSITSLTCSTAGTYDVYWSCARSSTSQTWGSQLYINGTAYGTENTTWTNHVQTNHLTGVTIPANATVAIYGRSRSGYYIYVPQLTIIQTA